jgi:hypothetical protein
MLDGKILPSDEMISTDQLSSSASQLRLLERELVNNSAYLDAKRAVEIFEKCQKEIKRRQKGVKIRASLDEMLQKREELLALVEEVRKSWDKVISDHDDTTHKRLEKLKKQQAEELSAFESEQPSDLRPLFKRSSVAYLQMRESEKRLALNRRFDEAYKMKKKADKLARVEQEENFEKMDLFYKDRRARLVEKQQITLRNYIEFAESKRRDFLVCKENQVIGHVARIKLIEREIQRIREENYGTKNLLVNQDPQGSENGGEKPAVQNVDEANDEGKEAAKE